jgi:hypothetical protein
MPTWRCPAGGCHGSKSGPVTVEELREFFAGADVVAGRLELDGARSWSRALINLSTSWVRACLPLIARRRQLGRRCHGHTLPCF